MIFSAGATVNWRNVSGGKVWSAVPARVLRDAGGVLTVAHWPGVECLAPASWTAAMRRGDERLRARALAELASGTWELDRWTWRDTTVISWLGVDPDFSVHRYRGERSWWYVNFQRPVVRTVGGVETLDLLLDLVLHDGMPSPQWKDEAEYEEGRRLGLVTARDHDRVTAARERALAMLAARTGPFADEWQDWSPGLDCPLPTLS